MRLYIWQPNSEHTVYLDLDKVSSIRTTEKDVAILCVVDGYCLNLIPTYTRNDLIRTAALWHGSKMSEEESKAERQKLDMEIKNRELNLLLSAWSRSYAPND